MSAADTPSAEPGGEQRPADPPASRLGLILWPSFLSACIASVLFFAAVDPELLRDAGPRLFADLDRETGYALGFFFFWVVAAIASALSVWLIASRGYLRRIRPTES
jgi:hypothetical protein